MTGMPRLAYSVMWWWREQKDSGPHTRIHTKSFDTVVEACTFYRAKQQDEAVFKACLTVCIDEWQRYHGTHEREVIKS